VGVDAAENRSANHFLVGSERNVLLAVLFQVLLAQSQINQADLGNRGLLGAWGLLLLVVWGLLLLLGVWGLLLGVPEHEVGGLDIAVDIAQLVQVLYAFERVINDEYESVGFQLVFEAAVNQVLGGCTSTCRVMSSFSMTK